jgi:NitT/TauT family transport system substrate-binding protein
MARKLFSPRLLATIGALAIAGTVLAGCSSPSSASTSGSAPKLIDMTLGSPGIPPVISGLMPYIASKQGFYKKYGLNVTIKSFATGTDATRAAATGQIDVAITPPAQLVQLDAAGSTLVGLEGQEFPDWVVVSTDPKVSSCASLKGQNIGVDAVGGIRYVALVQMLRTCGLAIADVHPLAFPGNANPQALVAGQLSVSVLHLNEVYSVESQGKKLTTAVKMSKAVPNTMYEMYSTTKAALSKNRAAYVKLIAAQIATINWMNDPKNANAVAQYATVTGGKKSDLLKAMAQYRALDFWSTADAAMPKLNVDNMIQSQIKAGNITAAKAPTYAGVTDLTVFTDAQKLVKKNGD